MSLPKIDPTTTKAWAKLTAHYNNTKNEKLTTHFRMDSGRASKFTLKWDDFFKWDDF